MASTLSAARRILLGIMLALPCCQAMALAPEEIEYFGLSKSGKHISLSYQGDGTENDYFYSYQKIPALTRCRITEDSIECLSTSDQAVLTSYARGHKMQAEFKAARKLFTKGYGGKGLNFYDENGVYMDRYWVCQHGCSPAVPRIFIEITHGD